MNGAFYGAERSPTGLKDVEVPQDAAYNEDKKAKVVF
jgi:hypothetical protein